MPTVLVTGATGHLGRWVVQELVDAGWTVRAGVRSAADTERTRPLRALDCAVVDCEVTDPAQVAAAVAGVDAVVNTAAVFRITAADPEREIVEPTVTGARTVVEAAVAAGVPRVVHTSSQVAVGTLPGPGGRALTEEDWNDTAPDAYARGKVASERAAWAAAEGSATTLVCLNPTGLLGPGFHRDTPITELVRSIVTGGMPMAPPIGFCFADVRDVAAAHVRALGAPTGRYLLSAPGWLSVVELAALVRAADPEVKPVRAMPRAMVGPVLAADAIGAALTRRPRRLDRDMVRTSGTPFAVDTARAREALGWRPRPLADSVRDTVAWLRDPAAA